MQQGVGQGIHRNLEGGFRARSGCSLKFSPSEVMALRSWEKQVMAPRWHGHSAGLCVCGRWEQAGWVN